MSAPEPAVDGGDPLPDEAWVTALAGLDGMGPVRLVALLDHHADPAAAWAATVAGRPFGANAAAVLGTDAAAVAARWSSAARAVDPAAVWRRHVEAGVGVALAGSPSYPAPFVGDPAPPAIVYCAGDPDAVVGPRVAVVGTRDCTRYGFDVARSLGADLAAAGVSVVSGLAVGIDGAAHLGALDVAGGAPPVAVVGSGLDVVYPRRHRDLWARVAAAGVVLSEHPLGTAPVAWHFPARNRLLAALADVVVVVESQERGGSMHTVEEAIRRGVDLLAVPGPVTSRASQGTNGLLADGAGVVRDADDVLVRLGLGPGRHRSTVDRRPPPAPGDRVVLDALDWQPAVLDQLVARTGLPLESVGEALDRLEHDGWVERRGSWFERRAKPDPTASGRAAASAAQAGSSPANRRA